MEIIEVNAAAFGEIIPEPYYTFGSAEFAGLNSDKAETVHYLLFKDGKYRLGLIGGLRENTFHSPFSAPFGGFVHLNENIKIAHIDQAIELLSGWANESNIKAISVCLPPAIYRESFIAKQINSFFRAGFAIGKIDLSYSFKLRNFDKNYLEHIWRNARKNTRIALEQNMDFKKCESEEEKRLAYDIVRKNREAKEFPLRMSWEQVRNTTRLIQADFFLGYTEDNEPISSAIIFHVSAQIVQVIYWGDIANTTVNKAMNFLAYKVFEYYKTQDTKIIDIGPSTEDSIPNQGLCEFKESIGCDIHPKITLIKKL